MFTTAGCSFTTIPEKVFDIITGSGTASGFTVPSKTARAAPACPDTSVPIMMPTESVAITNNDARGFRFRDHFISSCIPMFFLLQMIRAQPGVYHRFRPYHLDAQKPL